MFAPSLVPPLVPSDIPFALSVLVELDEVAAELFEMALRFSPIFFFGGGKKKKKKNCMKKSQYSQKVSIY